MGRHSKGDDPGHGRPEAGEPAGYPRPGEVTGAFAVGSAPGGAPGRNRAPGEPTGRWSAPRDAAPGSRPVRAARAAATATGNHRVHAADTPAESTGSRRAYSPTETTGSRRAYSPTSPTETTGTRRAVGTTSGDRRSSTGGSTGTSRPVAAGQPGRRGESTGTLQVLGVDGRPQLGRRRAGETTGCHRITPPGETTGSHRVVAEGKRGIAKWPIVAGVFVLLLVLGLLGWGWADDVLSNRAEAQASACAEGDSNLTVAAAPSVAPAITAAADRWNRAGTVVHSHCINVQVRALDDQRVLQALTGQGNLDSIGGQPAVWIPQTTAALTQLTTARPAVLTSPAESLATTAGGDYPCAVLTTDNVDEVQQRAAQVFRNFLEEPAQKTDLTRALTPGA
ncbi:substrate-binding domain-containing protein [Amycolatopsis viridis]|uniref:Extracellular solute-binding protein n=1 Tax=Amycolatopsis viridis TaxID=185678 RepID=A0ABX0SWI1_9PSEU|nr:substrate-binding domain-containing protein [Amycolatopsis viridis]NIH80893.1 hypothetical protein [Amycolatopsis viridis]